MILLYGLKNCDTCRKAVKALTGQGLEVHFFDVRRDGLDAETLAKFHDYFGEKLVNTRSTTWRELDAESRKTPPLELLALHPALMKRPVIDHDGTLYLGWGKEVQAVFNV